MKLFKRMIIVLGGGAAAALLIHALVVFIGFSGHEKSIHGTVSSMQDEGLSQSSKNAVLGNSAYLEEKINFRLKELELILKGKDAETGIQKVFQEKKNGDVDYIVVEKNGKTAFHLNPSRKSRATVLGSDKLNEFLIQVKKDIGTKKHYFYATPLYPGMIWIVCNDVDSEDIAVMRIDRNELLAGLPSINSDTAVALIFKNDFAAQHHPVEVPQEIIIRMKGICSKAEHNHEKRLITSSKMIDEKGNHWSISSANLFTLSENKAGLHLIYAQKTPEKIVQQISSIKDSFFGIKLLFTGALILAMLLFLPVLLIFSRHLAAHISNAVTFVRNVFQSEERPRNLESKFSSEMEELSGVLNLLRDKLSSALSRLSRSHERELRAKKEAEESNILRSGLLTSVLAEIRDPLSRIDGFSRIIQKKAGENQEISSAAEQIRVENRSMISVFRALSDLTSLDSDFCVLGSYQIEPSEIIRDAIGDLTARAARENISLELRNIAVPDNPITTSPTILTHTVYTAAATLIRFMPKNSTLRISTELNSNALIFRFADQPSDHLSIAEVFRKYTETGEIECPHCVVAVLNLLILKTEAEYLSADVRIMKNEEANSMIEIILPVRTFNPAVTGVFTRPKLMADPNKVSTAARFHVAGIISSSMSGRDPFRAEGSIGAVLLANLKAPDTTMYKMIFQSEGFAVAVAENEEERYEYLRENRFDLVLLDMTLEDATDYQVISRLRKALPAATVLIVLTDSRKVEYVEKLMENGADFCFRKPVVSGDMIAFVTKLKNGGKDLL
ncbi:MAG: hybrid sensor histidine kinase/response regulator [Lentisphaerae bacterium]|nr:hybrid sensor histidine kinase/response regulator [Lentisphaerota bacterium]